MSRSFEELVSEARAHPFEGWDFGYIEGRYVEGELPWDYRAILDQKLESAESYLDLGTGGGELLASLRGLPATSCVTEGYRPNVQVARRNLAPMGVDVVCNFCDDNVAEGPRRGALPFRDGIFDLVSSRHEAFIAEEVARVLRTGGTFLTQQVGPENDQELLRLVGHGEAAEGRWDLAEALRQTRGADLNVTASGEETVRSRFLDVGALAYYLKGAGPLEFEADSATIERALREADAVIRSRGAFEVTTSRFYLVAEAREAAPS